MSLPGWDLCIDSPLGLLGATASAEGLTRLCFDPAPRERPIHRDGAAHLARLERQLGEYFAGRRRQFEVPLAAGGNPFQTRVWALLQTIGYGQTRAYGALARALDCPGAARAVGLANGQNPIVILVPCHRVIGASGALTGYAGGLPRKRALLELEGALTASLF